jgi:hypothetical protein
MSVRLDGWTTSFFLSSASHGFRGSRPNGRIQGKLHLTNFTRIQGKLHSSFTILVQQWDTTVAYGQYKEYGRHERMHQTLFGLEVEYQSWKYPVLLIAVIIKTLNNQTTGSLILKIFKYRKLMLLWFWFFFKNPEPMSITKFKYRPPNCQYRRICNYRTKFMLPSYLHLMISPTMLSFEFWVRLSSHHNKLFHHHHPKRG